MSGPEYVLGLFRGKWNVSVWENGKRITRRSLGTADRQHAEKVLLPAFIAEMERPAETTVRYLWDRYISEKKGSRMVENMEWSGRAVLPFFGEMLPHQITHQTCRAYVTHRKKQGRKPGTIWTELNHLQIVLNRAKAQRLIPEAIALERPPKPPPKNVRLTKAEARSLIEAAKAEHVRVAIALMAGTAARVGAILTLTWDRVDFERGLISYADPADTSRRKGRATVPIGADLRPRLLAARERAFTEYVVEYAMRPVKSIKRGFMRAAADAGLKHATPHVLRHSAATWMAEAGLPMEEIAAVLGHSDSRTTERIYAKFSPAFLRRAVTALDLSGVPTGSREPANENEG